MKKIKNKSVFVGMDISMNGTGIVAIDQSKKILKTLKFEYNSSKKEYLIKHNDRKVKVPCDPFERAIICAREIIIFLEDLSRPRITIEGYDYNGHGKVFDIAEFCGYIKLEMYKAGFSISRITPPTSLKKFISGNGSVGKIGIEKALERKYGLNLRDHDLNDALALAIEYLENPKD